MNEIKREDYIKILNEFRDKQIIKIITGIRDSGKTTLIKMYQNVLRKSGVSDEQIITINFEDLENPKLIDRNELYKYIRSKVKKGKKTYIFLDEVQKVPEFEIIVESLFINKNVDLYIAGSNSKVISTELSTVLSDGFIEIKVLPISFKEYIKLTGTEKDFKDRLDEYEHTSTFPDIVNLKTNKIANIETYIDRIFYTVLFRDVMDSKGVTDKNVIEKVIKYLYENIGTKTSTKNINDKIEGLERNKSYNTVVNYVESLLNCYMFYKVNRFDIKKNEVLKTQEKYYSSDLGFIERFSLQKDKKCLLENLVYLELLRRKYEVFTGKLDNLDIDFVTKKGEEMVYFQIVLDTKKEYEFKNKLVLLQKINDNYPKYILTLDNEKETDYNGIKKKNIIEWLLN